VIGAVMPGALPPERLVASLPDRWLGDF